MWSDVSPRLQGDLVVIEPLAPAHEAALFTAAQPAEIWRWWPFNPALDRETFHAWMVGALDQVAAGREARFVVLGSGGEAIGSTSYCDLRPEHHGLEIGWTWFAPRVWGTGANAESKLLLLRHAFDRLGCRRVEFHTHERNSRSRAALAALPACLDGVLRDVKLMPDGCWRSSAVYSILEGEWERVEQLLSARVASHTDPSSPQET